MDLTTVVSGQILPDGTLHIADALALPPGPVRVHIEALAATTDSGGQTPPREIVEREPGPFLLDECISAPYDLPHDGPFQRIYPRVVENYLPEPHDIDESLE